MKKVVNIKLVFCALVVILIIISTNISFSQCDLRKSKDDFSSDQIISSSDVVLASVFPLIGAKKPWSIRMNFTIINNVCLVLITHASQSYSDDFSSLEFKLNDGNIITLDEPLSSDDYSSGIGNEYTISYFPISQENLKKLSISEVSKFRAVFTYFPDYPVVEEDLKSKNAAQIKKDAVCILSEIDLNKEEPKNESNDICTYEKDIIDDFTKIRTVLTKPKILYDIKLDKNTRNAMNVCGSNINGVRGLQFNRVVIYNSKLSVDEGALKSLFIFDGIDLMLQNDEIINIKESEPSKFIKNGTNVYFSYKVYPINNDSVWNKLGTIPIKKIRISINDKELEKQDIKDEYNKSFMNAINCINSLNIPKQSNK